MNATITKVADDTVLLVFACPECGLAATVHPGEGLVTNGTPVCQCCDGDMEYSHTCVGGEHAELIAAAKAVVDRWGVGDLAGAVNNLWAALLEVKRD